VRFGKGTRTLACGKIRGEGFATNTFDISLIAVSSLSNLPPSLFLGKLLGNQHQGAGVGWLF
jgi:hypothetical protein